MKKTLISVLSLLTLISITSCGNDNVSSNPTSTNPSTSQNEQASSTSQNEQVSSTSQTIDDDDIVVSTSATIHLTDLVDLSGKLSHTSVQEKFISYLNFHTMPDLFTKIEANETCEIKLYKDDKDVEQSYLCLGSRANSGYLTFHFSKELSEVTLYARPHYKYYNNVWNCDTNASIKVSVKDQDIDSTKLLDSSEGGQIPELTSFNVKFDTPTNEFTVSNIDSRLFLEKMDLEFNS